MSAQTTIQKLREENADLRAVLKERLGVTLEGDEPDRVERILGDTSSDVLKARALGMEPSLFKPAKLNATTIVGTPSPVPSGAGTWNPIPEDEQPVSKARARKQKAEDARDEEIGKRMNKVHRDIYGGGQ